MLADGTDVGAALADPVERERRYQRARKHDQRYATPDKGRRAFDADDKVHLEGGIDLVRTMEEPPGHRERVAQQRAAEAATALDAAIKSGADKRQRLRLLDAEISKLEGPTQAARDAVADQLRSEATDSDQRCPEDVGRARGGRPTGRCSDAGRRPGGVAVYDAIKSHMTANGLPERDFAQACSISTRRPASLPETPETPAKPEVPPGVHPGSYALEQRVRALMAEAGARESEYMKFLDQAMKES